MQQPAQVVLVEYDLPPEAEVEPMAPADQSLSRATGCPMDAELPHPGRAEGHLRVRSARR